MFTKQAHTHSYRHPYTGAKARTHNEYEKSSYADNTFCPTSHSFSMAKKASEYEEDVFDELAFLFSRLSIGERYQQKVTERTWDDLCRSFEGLSLRDKRPRNPSQPRKKKKRLLSKEARAALQAMNETALIFTRKNPFVASDKLPTKGKRRFEECQSSTKRRRTAVEYPDAQTGPSKGERKRKSTILSRNANARRREKKRTTTVHPKAQTGQPFG